MINEILAWVGAVVIVGVIGVIIGQIVYRTAIFLKKKANPVISSTSNLKDV